MSDINISDLEWHDHIIGQLDESEFWNGVPRMDGLRRLVEKNISKIVNTYVNLSFNNSGNVPIAIATATIVLENGDTHTACSDANPYSVDPVFRNRLSAIADNRAKSKAYREILRLGNIASSDELSGSADQDEQEPIIDSQKAMITNLAKSNKVDVDAVCKSMFDVDVESLKYTQAGSLIKRLSNWKAGRETVPAEFVIVKGKK